MSRSTPAEKAETARAARAALADHLAAPTEATRAALIVAHRPLAFYWAKRSVPRAYGPLMEELNAAAMVGLVRAVDTWRPGAGSTLGSWIRLKVRGAVLGELGRLRWFPRDAGARVLSIDQAADQSDAERRGTAGARAVSGRDAGEIARATSRPDGTAERVEHADGAERAMDGATPRQAEALRLYYVEGRPMAEVAKIMGASVPVVSTLIYRATGHRAQIGSDGKKRLVHRRVRKMKGRAR